MSIKSAKTNLMSILFLTVFFFSLGAVHLGTVNAQQCDPNPACDPMSGTCCTNQCDPNPACVASDPNAMPCCNAGDMSPGGPHGDPCMEHPAGPARDTCYQNQPVPGQMGSCPEGPGYDACIAAQSAASATKHHPGGPGPNDHHNGPGDHGPGPNGHHNDQDAGHCRAMGMADGSPHVDPPQDVLDQVQAEYEANCKSGNCFLGEGNYKLLEGMGHTRQKVDCFLAEGHRKHDEQHGGPGDGNHPPAP